MIARAIAAYADLRCWLAYLIGTRTMPVSALWQILSAEDRECYMEIRQRYVVHSGRLPGLLRAPVWLSSTPCQPEASPTDRTG